MGSQHVHSSLSLPAALSHGPASSDNAQIWSQTIKCIDAPTASHFSREKPAFLNMTFHSSSVRQPPVDGVRIPSIVTSIKAPRKCDNTCMQLSALYKSGQSLTSWALGEDLHGEDPWRDAVAVRVVLAVARLRHNRLRVQICR